MPRLATASSMKRQATLNRSTSLAWTASRSCSLAVALEALDELKVVDLAQAVELSRSLSSELPTLEELAEPEMLEDLSYHALAAKAAGIHELILHQATLHPETTAIIDGATDTKYTYEQLRCAALKISKEIRRKVKKGSAVAVALPRSFNLVATLLGAMLAECTWVYLDPSYPDAHKKVVVEDSAAGVVVTKEGESSFVGGEGMPPAITVEEMLAAPEAARPTLEGCFSGNLDDLLAGSLMAILYTSGSTGRPKGVRLEHLAVLASMILEPWQGVNQGDVFAQCSSAGFPGSLHDLWLPLVRGAALCTIPRETLLEPANFKATVAKFGITSAFLTPRVLELYADSAPDTLDGMKRVWVAGEAVRPDAMAVLAQRETGPDLWNLYGCTEHCGCISGFKVTADIAAELAVSQRTPIGVPSKNVTVALLDDKGNVITEPGKQGEIWVSGPQLADGYHNLDKVTNERFVELPNLTGAGENPNPHRFYRTGDLGMWHVAPGAKGPATTDNMVLDHMGRAQGVDSMVKVNGYNVQLSAVEAAAVSAAAGALGGAAAVLHSSGKLALYYVVNPGHEVTTRALRSSMASLVPPYMIPAFFVAIPKIPLNAHGKIDKGALPDPTTVTAPAGEPGEAITDETEAAVAAAMAQVMGTSVAAIKADDSFVWDMGANSLSLFVLLPELRKLAPEIDIGDVMVPGDDTPRLLAKRIKQLNNEDAFRALSSEEAKVAGGPLIYTPANLPGELVVVNRNAPSDILPVFIVHGGAGNSPVGLDMAMAMRGKRPLIAITLSEAAAASANEHPVNVCLGLASAYCDAVQKVQPAGPYTLAGVGRGSLIAYEMGREMEARGEIVTAVVALDYVFRPGTVGPEAANAETDKDFLTVESHMTVVTRLLAGGRNEALTEAQAEAAVKELEATLAATTSRAARGAAIKEFIATVVAPSIAEGALRAFNTLGKAMNYDPVTGRGPGAPKLAAPMIVARAEDKEFMDAIYKRGNTATEADVRNLGWNAASSYGDARVVDVPGTHMNLLLSPESAQAVAELFISI